MTLQALLLVAGAVSTVAAAPAGKAARVKLPADWAAGSQHHYRAVWTRAIDVWRAPGSPPPSMNTEQRGQIMVRVTERSKEAYLVRWEPTLTTTYLPRAQGDVDAAGAELWRFGLTLALDLDVRTTGEVTVRNGREVRERLAGRYQEILREMGFQPDLDCVGRDAASISCRVVGTEAAATATALRFAGPFFGCIALDLNVRAPETWSQAHSSPEIGKAVSIEFRREVLDYAAQAPRIRVRTVWQPNATQLQAWIKGKVAELPGDQQQRLAELTDQFSFRFETDCTMDRRTGWPVEIEFKSSGGSALYQGSDSVRFERVEVTAAPDR